MSYIKEREDGCGVYVMWGETVVADLERHEARDMLKELDKIVHKWDNQKFAETRDRVYKHERLTWGVQYH